MPQVWHFCCSSVGVLQRLFARRFSGSRLVQRTNFTLRGIVNARPVRIPVLAGIGMQPAPYWEEEAWLNRPIAALLATGDGAFVDVGVNLGQTLLKVQTLRPGTRYVGFEPNPVCVTYVRRLVLANGLTDCTVAPFGLSDRPCALTMFARDDDLTDSSATVVAGLRSTQETWGRTPVAVLPGDDALAALDVGRVGIIKIDVEGAELEVVRGLQRTLDAQRPHVICEILGTGAEGGARWAFRQPRAEALLSIMRGFGYRLFRLLPDGGGVALETIEPHADAALTNYAFVRADAAEAFARAIRIPARAHV
jgi:FkbM family methyltransferase